MGFHEIVNFNHLVDTGLSDVRCIRGFVAMVTSLLLTYPPVNYCRSVLTAYDDDDGGGDDDTVHTHNVIHT